MCSATWPGGRQNHRHHYLDLVPGRISFLSGPFAAILITYEFAHVLGWLMLAATLIPVAYAVIVLHQGGSSTVAFGVHGGAAVAMLIISGLLLIDSWNLRNRVACEYAPTVAIVR